MNPLAFLPSLSAAASVVGAATRRVGQGVHSFAAALEAATGEPPSLDGSGAKSLAAEPFASRPARPSALYRRLVGPAASFAPEPPRLGDLEALARQTLDEVRHQLRRQLRVKGIEDVQGLRVLVRSGDGQIVATGDPISRAAVEQIFEQDPGLANMLREAAATYEVVRAGKEHLRFALAYDEDPRSALARFSHLFDDNRRGTFSVTLDEFGADAEFV